MNIPSKTCFILLQMAAVFLLLSCSNSDESSEKDIIERTTDKIAQDATNMIKNPINKAKHLENLSSDHTGKLEEAAKQE